MATDVRGRSGFLRLRIRWEADDCVIELHGELDMSNTDQLADAVHAAVDTGCTSVVVDMAGLRFADLHGIQPVLDEAVGLEWSIPVR